MSMPTMPRITPGTIVRVLLLCFVVGLILAFLDVDPRNLFHDLIRLGRELFDMSIDFVNWAGKYVWMGAVVVVPVWAVVLLYRYLRGRT
jgi:hypothetical protein